MAEIIDNESGLPEGMDKYDLLAAISGKTREQIIRMKELSEQGFGPAEIGSILFTESAPNDRSRDFYQHNATHVLDVLKGDCVSLYHDGPTIPLTEVVRNREYVNFVIDDENLPPDFPKEFNSATFKQIAEDLGDFVDSAAKRLAAGDEELNRVAAQDIATGLAVLLRGLSRLSATSEEHLVDLRDDEDSDSEPDPAA